MKYTNFILTAIAILLALHLLKPLFSPAPTHAEVAAVDVNIAYVGGISTPAGIMPVHDFLR